MKITILTNFLPSYRMAFYDQLFNFKNFDITIYCQETSENEGFKGIESRYGKKVKIVKYFSFNKGFIVWHFLPLKDIFKSDIIFSDGNMRHLSQALLISILRIFNKNIIIWSTAHSRFNSGVFQKIRLFWWRMFDYFYMYNPVDIVNLRKSGVKGKLMVSANNGLDQREIDRVKSRISESELWKFKNQNCLDGRQIGISLGRLVQGRFDTMVEALPYIINSIPNFFWIVIGDGPDRSRIQENVDKKSLNQFVLFLGPLFKEEDLAPWLLSANVLIHPSPIGLSLLHGFGYGLPAITISDFKIQGPEFCAFEDGKTGRLFKNGNSKDLANVVIAFFEDVNSMINMKEYVLSIVKNDYNVDVMVNNFVRLVNEVYLKSNS